MYIQAMQIDHIRSIQRLNFELAPEECPGWHVFIGENGSGKSTVLRAAALALIGPDPAQALRQNWGDWLSGAGEFGVAELMLLVDEPGHEPQQSKAMRQEIAKVLIRRDRGRGSYLEAGAPSFRGEWMWAFDRGGANFSASYGPFRRFTGGAEYTKLTQSFPRLAPHLTIFGEDAALTETQEWLRELKFKQLEERTEGGLLDRIETFVNQDGFLPHRAKLVDVTSDGVFFEDANGQRVSVDNLSDGYRSILSMTFDLIRHMKNAFGDREIFSEDSAKVIASGVVLIDEVDAHLHPTWQRRIGFWLHEHFPNLQFIVTTHSPLVCQAAVNGSVWKLPKPGTDEVCRRVEGQDLDRLLYGDLVDAYSTRLFGITDTRADEGKAKLERLAQLNLQEVFRGLSDPERKEQSHLRAILPTQANTSENDS